MMCAYGEFSPVVAKSSFRATLPVKGPRFAEVSCSASGVKVATIGDHTTYRGAVPADIFGGRTNDASNVQARLT
jgi:hypothetical protein